MPTRVLSDESPHFRLHRSPPSHSYLRVFGCLWFPVLRHYNHNKLQFRSSPCVFLGYPPSYCGYRYLDTNKVFIYCHVRFDDTVFPFVSPIASQVATSRSEPWVTAPILTGQGSDVSTMVTDGARKIHEPVVTSGGDAGHSHEQSALSERTVSDQQVELRGRPRERLRRATPPPRSHSMNTRSSCPHQHVALTTISTILPEPTCYSQAVKFPKWGVAMDVEFIALVHNHTWRLVPSQQDRVTAFIDKLALEFKVRDMGVPYFFLGIETVQLSGGMVLSQQRYMKDILKRAGMVDCKPVITHVSSAKITDDVVVLYVDPTQYRSLVGALQLGLSKGVLRYVKGTMNLGLRISQSTSMDIHAYSDSDWVGDPNDHKSTSGFAMFLGSNLISWVCRKQRTVARSSTGAEYKGHADVSAEVTWLVSLLHEIGIPPASPPPVVSSNDSSLGWTGALQTCMKFCKVSSKDGCSSWDGSTD
ncbi:PREDICTED: uncharacterized protein LOC109154150 [Ipomoea nil]|uniref:uncharacterized protein LOC109154150 n=1 Tax=Ipomoea nil TaxID=35883 RepID=UPI000901579F|nr:PREDICTED: uncharacterized protein LOC109154150 [Ipomoea nil]